MPPRPVLGPPSAAAPGGAARPGYYLAAGGGGEGGTCRGALGGGEAPAAGGPGRNGGERAATADGRLPRPSRRQPSAAGGAAERWGPTAVPAEPALPGARGVSVPPGAPLVLRGGRARGTGWYREYWDSISTGGTWVRRCRPYVVRAKKSPLCVLRRAAWGSVPLNGYT